MLLFQRAIDNIVMITIAWNGSNQNRHHFDEAGTDFRTLFVDTGSGNGIKWGKHCVSLCVAQQLIASPATSASDKALERQVCGNVGIVFPLEKAEAKALPYVLLGRGVQHLVPDLQRAMGNVFTFNRTYCSSNGRQCCAGGDIRWQHILQAADRTKRNCGYKQAFPTLRPVKMEK